MHFSMLGMLPEPGRPRIAKGSIVSDITSRSSHRRAQRVRMYYWGVSPMAQDKLAFQKNNYLNLVFLDFLQSSRRQRGKSS